MRPIIKFLQEARTELAKVTWPTRSTVINLTLAVLLISAILTAYTAGVDYVLTEGIKWVTAQAEVIKSKRTSTAPSSQPTIDIGGVETAPAE